MSSLTLIGAHRAVSSLLETRPKSWDVTRFKGLFDRLDQRNSDLSYEMLSLRSTGEVVARAEMGGRQEPDEINLPKYLVAEIDDLVVNPMWLIGGGIGVSRRAGAVSPDYRVFRSRGALLPRFIHYLLRSQPYLDQYLLYTRAQTTFDRRVQQPDLDNLPMPVPPLEEQRTIADYLDRETARIDTLIGEQQRLIEMLRERRRDLVRVAVLGSANPFSPPPEAPFTAIGHHFSVTLGKMLDAGKAVRGEDRMLPYIRAGNIQDAGLKLDDVKEMPYSEAEAANLNLLKGDLLVVEGGAVGTNVLLREDMPEWSFQKTVNRLRPLHNWSSAWLGYVLRTYRDIGVIDIVCNRSTIPHLTAEKLRAMRVPSVDPQEQVRVAATLDRQTAEIDVLIVETERFIELSRERRAALITAAVTGQIDLREMA